MNELLSNRFRYAHRGDQTILIGVMPEEQLDPLDLVMLRAVRVPNLLPIDIRMSDRMAEVVYGVGRRKPLNEWLRSQHGLSDDRCLLFILHIANVCLQLRDYMLIENRCLLLPERIFVQEQLLDAEFVYYPDRQRTWEEDQIARDIQQVCLYLTRYGTGRGIAGEIMRWCEDPMFTLDGLRKKLVTWMDQYDARTEEAPTTRNRPQDASRNWLKRLMPFCVRRRQESFFRQEAGHATIPIQSAHEMAGDAVVEYIGPDQETKRCTIARTPFIIGRDRQIADLAFDHAALSRVHAEIKRLNGGYVVRDLGSSNGTCLNGKDLPPYTDFPLSSGDLIDIADIRLCFVLDKGDPVV